MLTEVEDAKPVATRQVLISNELPPLEEMSTDDLMDIARGDIVNIVNDDWTFKPLDQISERQRKIVKLMAITTYQDGSKGYNIDFHDCLAATGELLRRAERILIFCRSVVPMTDASRKERKIKRKRPGRRR